MQKSKNATPKVGKEIILKIFPKRGITVVLPSELAFDEKISPTIPAAININKHRAPIWVRGVRVQGLSPWQVQGRALLISRIP